MLILRYNGGWVNCWAMAFIAASLLRVKLGRWLRPVKGMGEIVEVTIDLR